MSKNNRHGQAEILSASDCDRIRRSIISKHHLLLWDIARYTGERWGAIRQLKVSDVYQNAIASVPRAEITFQKHTRKASPSGKQETRQCPVHPELARLLQAYKPNSSGYLFSSGMGGVTPISFSACDKWLRSAVVRAGLGHRGIATHSTRRSFITILYYDRGVDIQTLQAITGHSDLKSLQRYIEVSDDRKVAAIALL
jgi:integrase/recombinase XerD